MAFQEIINSDKPVLVVFFADWCGPCKMMSPILKELKRRVRDDAQIIKINVDQSPEAAAAYNVSGVPTIIIFRKGQIRWRQSGVFPANELERLINENK
jgi:thioredoxin 1